MIRILNDQTVILSVSLMIFLKKLMRATNKDVYTLL